MEMRLDVLYDILSSLGACSIRFSRMKDRPSATCWINRPFSVLDNTDSRLSARFDFASEERVLDRISCCDTEKGRIYWCDTEEGTLLPLVVFLIRL